MYFTVYLNAAGCILFLFYYSYILQTWKMLVIHFTMIVFTNQLVLTLLLPKLIENYVSLVSV